MSERENPVERGRAIVDGHWYMTLATADASGRPWASPVWFAHDGYPRRLVEFRGQALTPADVTAPAAHRLFRAVPAAQFVLDATDHRIPVALG